MILVLLSSVNVFILNYFSDIKSIALFDTIVMLLNLLVFPITAFSKILEPNIKNSIGKVNKVNEKNKILSMVLLYLGAVFLFIFSDETLLIFGDSYVAASNPLKLGIVFFVFSSLLGPVSEYLNMSGSSKINTCFLILSLFVNTFLCYFLNYEFTGVNAAILSLGISMMLCKLLSFLYFKNKNPQGAKVFVYPPYSWFLFLLSFIIIFIISPEHILIKVLLFLFLSSTFCYAGSIKYKKIL